MDEHYCQHSLNLNKNNLNDVHLNILLIQHFVFTVIHLNMSYVNM